MQRNSFSHRDWFTRANDEVKHGNRRDEDRCDQRRARSGRGGRDARDNQEATDEEAEKRHQERNFESSGSFVFAQFEDNQRGVHERKNEKQQEARGGGQLGDVAGKGQTETITASVRIAICGVRRVLCTRPRTG